MPEGAGSSLNEVPVLTIPGGPECNYGVWAGSKRTSSVMFSVANSRSMVLSLYPWTLDSTLYRAPPNAFGRGGLSRLAEAAAPGQELGESGGSYQQSEEFPVSP